MALFVLLVTCLCLDTTLAMLSLKNQTQFMLGGLYGMHQSIPEYPLCGNKSLDEIMLSEAHVFSTRWVNENLLANKRYKLGMYIIDTCNSNSIGIEHSVKLVENSSHDLCPKNLLFDPKNPPSLENKVYAVTGTFSSAVGKNINYLLEAFCLPLIGAVSTSPVFDSEIMFPYFLRTVASDKYQAKVVIHLLLKMGWTMVTVVYDSSTYGYYLSKEFQDQIGDKICLEYTYELKLYKEDMKWDNLREKLEKEGSSKVVVLFLGDGIAKTFFEHIDTWGLSDQLQFIGVDGWSAWIDLDGLEHVIKYSITSEPEMDQFDIFRDYMNDITLKNVSYNPWLTSVLEEQNNCSFTKSASGLYPNPCTGKEKLINGSWVALRKSRKVFESVYIVADGIRRMQEDYCPGSDDVCPDLAVAMSGRLLHDYMRKTTINVPGVDNFTFYNGTTSGYPKYSLYQFNGSGWTRIGKYDCMKEVERLKLDNSSIVNSTVWPKIAGDMHECKGPCLLGSYNQSMADRACCHKCIKCSKPFEYVNMDGRSPQCSTCKNGQVPNTTTYTNCVDAAPPDVFGEFTIMHDTLLALCALGLVVTSISCMILFWNQNTPMARAALVDLMLMLGSGVMLLFLCPVLMLPSTSEGLCGAGWFVGSLVLTYCHSIALVKAVRLARPSWYAKLVNDRMCRPELASKLVIFASLMPQLLIAFMWLFLSWPTMLKKPNADDDKEEYIWMCSSNNTCETLVVIACPIIYLFASVPFFLRALQNPFMFLVWQTRFIVVGWLSLTCTYIVLLLVFFLQIDDTEVGSKAVLLMSIPLITGYLFWFSMIFPVVYVLVAKRNRNINQYVKRRRPQLFTEGNVIWMVTPVVRPSLKSKSDIVTEQPSRHESFEETFNSDEEESNIHASESAEGLVAEEDDEA